LLQSADRLCQCLAASPAQGVLELWQLLLAHQRGDSNTNYSGGLLKVPLREYCGNGFLLLAPEFCAVTDHLLLFAPIPCPLPTSSPFHRLDCFLFDFACIPGRSE